jgi:hypothetical protein
MVDRADFTGARELGILSADDGDLHYLPEVMRPYRETVSSAIAALMGTMAGFPLDSVKTRMQTHKFQNSWKCFADTYRMEGLKGFYRGMYGRGAVL